MAREQLTPELLELIARRFRLLAEAARLSILHELMSGGERTVTELVEATGLNQANLSKHLQLLRSAGFVARRQDGVYARYSLADDSVAALCEIMCGRLEAQLAERAAVLADAG